MDSIPENLQEALLKHSLVVVFFHSPDCSVCQSLEPKLHSMLEREHPSVPFIPVNLTENPRPGVLFNVYSLPALLVFTEGKEAIRRIRNFSILEISQQLSRYENLING